MIVATTHPWPSVQPCIEILIPQCDALGAQLLICDSTGQAIPASLLSIHSCLQYLTLPDSSVFDLRAHGTAAATGDIVAWTEDHCLPAPDFCAKHCQAHTRFPNADIIGGAVLNGSCDNSMDWANFLCTFGPLLPPLNITQHNRAPAVANLSLKRRVIPPTPISPGFIEFTLQSRQLKAGAVRFDDSIQVTHVQSWGFFGSIVAHFHNGRSTTGLLSNTLPTRKRLRQIAACFAMPVEVLRTSITPLLSNPDIHWTRYVPHMLLLALAFSAGELIGLLSNSAGRSPHLLE